MKMLFAAVHESGSGTKRRFVATHQFGRYRGKADIPLWWGGTTMMNATLSWRQ
jgi:hypothetical protein